jgi:lincosamide nucleotidyltransferase A/C/D/E
MVSAEDAVAILRRLRSHGIQVWLTGGWGIDALLEEQTRPHKDIDFVLLLEDVAPMQEALALDGYRLEDLWPENRTVAGASGAQLPTAFVLRDPAGRRIDAHAMVLDEQGNAIPAWSDEEGLVLCAGDLAGTGTIDGFPVRCLTPAMQVACHSGYAMPEYQIRDMALLRERFGVDPPG